MMNIAAQIWGVDDGESCVASLLPCVKHDDMQDTKFEYEEFIFKRKCVTLPAR